MYGLLLLSVVCVGFERSNQCVVSVVISAFCVTVVSFKCGFQLVLIMDGNKRLVVG